MSTNALRVTRRLLGAAVAAAMLAGPVMAQEVLPRPEPAFKELMQ